MIYTPNEILEIGGDAVTASNIHQPDQPYEWIDVLGIPQRPQQMQHSLFFATELDGNDTWHNPVNRRAYAPQVSQQGHDVAYESPAPIDIKASGIETTSLSVLSQRLFEETRRNTNPYIVGVTGSVGKTTSVAFMEHLLQEAGLPVVRFWSKRLTPLLVQCHYINRVTEGTGFVVMEYSAYKHHHVQTLAELLPPNIAFLSNIYNTHINPDGFTSKLDIYNSKKRIKPTSQKGFINQQVLDALGMENPEEKWETFSVADQFISNNKNLPPTLRTAELYTMGLKLAQEVGISEATFARAFATFTPQERRIISTEFHNKQIFFDGESTYGSRLWSWFETVNGSNPVMLIESVFFGNEDVDGFADLLTKIVCADTTYILDTPENRKLLPHHSNFVKKEVFGKLMHSKDPRHQYVVYHKAMATRDKDFNPELYLNKNF